MLKLNDTQKNMLQSVYRYVESDGVGFSGHHMMHLLYLIDRDRNTMHKVLKLISDSFDEGDYAAVRAVLAEYFSNAETN